MKRCRSEKSICYRLQRPVADDYYDKAPFKFEGTLNKLHFKYLEAERAAIPVMPDD
jgi:hypothetical protein